MEEKSSSRKPPVGRISPDRSSLPKGTGRGDRQHLYITFVTMLALWMVLSGKFDPFHISLGVVSSGLVSYLSADLLFSSSGMKALFLNPFPFIRYLPWLLYQIFLANLNVLYIVCHPRMIELIDPHIVRFKSRLKSDLALVTFANSITLTPGTITVYVSMDAEFQVHALDRRSGESLPGEMERRIARAFGEE